MAAREEGAPFCYWFGPTNVHRKWTRGSGKTLWGLDPDELKGRMPKFLPDVHEVREDLASVAHQRDRGVVERRVDAEPEGHRRSPNVAAFLPMLNGFR